MVARGSSARLLDVHRLSVLREFADRGTVGEAAEALAMTPSAVSQSLRVLAADVGVDLLEPDGRRLRLTDAGRALVLRADEILAAVVAARAEMDAYRRTGGGRVRIALFPSGAALLLGVVLDRLEAAGIEVEAHDIDASPAEVPGLLADFDVVLTHRDEGAEPVARLPVGGVANRLTGVDVLREPVDLVVAGRGRQRHRLAGRGSVSLGELADEAWISVRGGFPVDDVLTSVAAATGISPRVVQRLNDFRVLQEVVATGRGVALLPRYSVDHPGLDRLVLEGVRAARVYEVVWRRHGRRSPTVTAAVDALRVAADEAIR